MTARDLRLDAVFLEDLACDHADRENRRLRIRREAQIFFRPMEAHVHDGVAERLVRFAEQPLRHVILLMEILAHANLLGALSGEYECELVHQTDLSFLWHEYRCSICSVPVRRSRRQTALPRCYG